MASISKKEFGRLSNGSLVYSYTLENRAGAKATIITYGARIQSFLVPDKEGNFRDIVLGFDTAKGYEEETFYMGAIVGPHANRIQNAEFTINNTTYYLECNDGANHTNSLHSGSTGFHDKIWGAEINNGKLLMYQFRPDGEGGFPGTLTAQVTYDLTEDNALKIDYQVTCDSDTICNMTNHSYFNLNGIGGGTILNHKLQIMANSLTESDAEALPNGKIYQAEGTPMDFRQLTPIGERIDDDFQQLIWGAGYDHNWILSGPVKDGLRQAAFAVSEESGITLSVYTDMPGMQFYSGNFLDGTPGKKDIPCKRRSGFALETQYFPNSPMHPEFPQPVLKRGNTWNSTTIFKAGLAE